MPVLAAQGLTVSIAGIPVCDDLDLVIEAGDRWCLLGRNGAGKTTLLHTLLGFHPPCILRIAAPCHWQAATCLRLPIKNVRVRSACCRRITRTPSRPRYWRPC